MRHAEGLAGWLLTAIVLLVFFALARVGQAGPPTIMVLASHNTTPYQEMLKGCQQHLSDRSVAVRYEQFSLDGDPKKMAQIMERAKQQEAVLLYSLGSLTTRAALREIPDRPIVAGLVLDAQALDQASNVTGVVLDFPPEIHFEWLQRLVPDHLTVGVLYNPAENQQKITAAEAIARKLGLKLVGAEVNAPKEMPAALDMLLRRVDVLWGMPDKLVLSAKTAKAILLTSFRNRVPLVGPSSAWVKAGALYSLDWDYRDMGRQTGEMIVRILRGEPVSKIPPVAARKVSYTLNLKTARHMKLEFPAKHVAEARQVIE